MRLIHKTALGVTALATAAVLTGCTGGGNDKASGGEPRSAVQALQAAAKKTEEAKSAKVEMTISMPEAAGGDMKMSGVLGWDPIVMDVTASGAAFAEQGAPGEMRMLWVDDVMYMNAGEEAIGGKPWLKMDFNAMLKMAEESGEAGALDGMSKSIQNMNRQDPVKQMALLLGSPSIKRVGEEKVDGVDAERYSGTLTMKEALEASGSSLGDYLTEEEYKELLGNMEKSGVKGFDINAWVNEDDLPVKIDMKMDSPEGEIVMSQTYKDYGTSVSVQPPPAGETADMLQMIKDLQEAGANLESSEGL
ncbi:hypothetical protein CUT44_08105 [Streptomyces carminius]|uniref:Lipoprotein n=1 Tax=Streptomyces carminius TaxID=2665496 RepID=A0A2M8M1Y3_9ACTN|nr:hypothetical protein [Streptomyces carminius]PJE98223.1 hypothetical protein CUT44_08105 [Streptomyces carminius]